MVLQDDGLYRTSDGAATWEMCLSCGGTADGLVFDEGRSGIVWVRAYDRLYRSQNGGATWGEVKGPWTGKASLSAFSPDRGGSRALACTDRGEIFFTEDAGKRWKGVETPRLLADLTHGGGSIAVDPVDHDRAYVGTGGAGPTFGTTNGGRSWTVIHDWGAVRVVVHPEQANHLFLVGGRNSGILESIDYGSTWTEAGDFRRDTDSRESQKASALCFVAGQPNRLYLATRSEEEPVSGDPASWAQVATSGNGGDSWTLLPFREPFKEIIAVTARPGLRNSLLLFTSSCEAYRSLDGGESWGLSLNIKAEPLYAAQNFVASDPSNPNFVVFLVPSTSEGPKLYVTEDFGESWSDRSPPGFRLFAVHSVAVDRPSPQVTRIVIGGGRPDGRLYLSDDLGFSWGLATTGIDDGLCGIAISGDGTCYATTVRNGVVKGVIRLPTVADDLR